MALGTGIVAILIALARQTFGDLLAVKAEEALEQAAAFE